MTPLAEQDLVAETSRTTTEEWLEPLPPELRPPRASRRRRAVDRGRRLRRQDQHPALAARARLPRRRAAAHRDLGATSRRPAPTGSCSPTAPATRRCSTGRSSWRAQALGRIPLLRHLPRPPDPRPRRRRRRTSRLPFGHHGANHPVKDLETGRVHITSQNHEFQVDAASLPAGRLLRLAAQPERRLGRRARPPHAAGVQRPVPPRGLPGPAGQPAPLRPLRRDGARAQAGAAVQPAEAPDAERPRKVLILGSGPIVIGQAAEFDYAGTQACKALREEGIETVLVNSNPATIMTDEEVADRVYLEPLTVEAVERVIARERPDALLPDAGRPDRPQPRDRARRRRRPRPLRRPPARHAASRRSARPRTARPSRRCSSEIGEPVPDLARVRVARGGRASSPPRSACRWSSAPPTRSAAPAAASSTDERRAASAIAQRRPRRLARSTRCSSSARCGAGRRSSTR